MKSTWIQKATSAYLSLLYFSFNFFVFVLCVLWVFTTIRCTSSMPGATSLLQIQSKIQHNAKKKWNFASLISRSKVSSTATGSKGKSNTDAFYKAICMLTSLFICCFSRLLPWLRNRQWVSKWRVLRPRTALCVWLWSWITGSTVELSSGQILKHKSVWGVCSLPGQRLHTKSMEHKTHINKCMQT